MPFETFPLLQGRAVAIAAVQISATRIARELPLPFRGDFAAEVVGFAAGSPTVCLDRPPRRRRRALSSPFPGRHLPADLFRPAQQGEFGRFTDSRVVEQPVQIIDR